MPSVQKSLRIPEETARTIEDIAHASRRDFSSIVNEMLAEAIKMRRCPGIVFVEGIAGRRARIAGTGLDVWEVVAGYLSLEQDLERLRNSYHWLSDLQLRAALGYYAIYPEDIAEQIARNEAWTSEQLAKEYPTVASNSP